MRINIKTLGPGWTDRDEVLVHAMMQILTDYVEGEMLSRMTWEERCGWYDKSIANSTENLDKQLTQNQYDHDKKIYEIYKWWHTRGKSYDPYEDISKGTDNCSCSEEMKCDLCWDRIKDRFDLEEAFSQERTQKCIDLIHLRSGLWT